MKRELADIEARIDEDTFLSRRVFSIGLLLVLVILTAALLATQAVADPPTTMVLTAIGNQNVQTVRQALTTAGRDLYICYYPLQQGRPVYCQSVGNITRGYPSEAIAVSNLVRQKVESWARLERLAIAGEKLKAVLGSQLMGCTGTNISRAGVLLTGFDATGVISQGPTGNCKICSESPSSPSSINIGNEVYNRVLGEINELQSSMYDLISSYYAALSKHSNDPRYNRRLPMISTWRLVIGKIWSKIHTIKEDKARGGGGGIRGYYEDCFVDMSCGNTYHESSIFLDAFAKAIAETLAKREHKSCTQMTPAPGSSNICYQVLSGNKLNKIQLAQFKKEFCDFQAGMMQPAGEGQSICALGPQREKLQAGISVANICQDPRAMCSLDDMPRIEPGLGGAPPVPIPTSRWW